MDQILHIDKTPEELADTFAIQLIAWANTTKENIFHLALSGGKTPILLFSLLAGKYAGDVPWQKIHFWWGDERMVPPENPESNFGVVNRILFSKIDIPEFQIHRIKGEGDPNLEAINYNSEIISLVPSRNGWPVFDLIMLGMGDDGHIASIFPDQMQLLDSNEITGIAHHPLTGQQRITLTGKVLNNAKKISFLITGASKAQIFREIMLNSISALAYPASHIHPVGEMHWFVDEGCVEGS